MIQRFLEQSFDFSDNGPEVGAHSVLAGPQRVHVTETHAEYLYTHIIIKNTVKNKPLIVPRKSFLCPQILAVLIQTN